MGLSALGAVLLFALAIPVVMEYRILPIPGTPYWLFGILFLLLTLHILVTLVPKRITSADKLQRIRRLFVWSVLIIVVGGTTVTAIVDRSKTASVWGVHDIILQQEAAMRYLLEGKNPYKETYFGTPMESWYYAEGGTQAVNPALYHFVMPPWYLLFPFVFSFVTIPTLGFFDGRFILLFSMFGSLAILSRWFKNKSVGSLAMILTALSPTMIDFFIEGRSDIFALFWLVWSLFLLERKKYFFSSILFGVSLVTKQTTWLVAPFYIAYVWIVLKKSQHLIFGYIAATAGVVAAVALPFVVWDAAAFANSVIFFLSGNTAHAYPISGYGLGMLLSSVGIIKDLHAYYPFIVWQIAFGLPTLVISLWWLRQKPSIGRVLIGYASVLLVVWYMSRYVNNSHMGYIAHVFMLGVFKYVDENEVFSA